MNREGKYKSKKPRVCPHPDCGRDHHAMLMEMEAKDREKAEAGRDLGLRCRYYDCENQNPVAGENEKVTCEVCRKELGLPSYHTTRLQELEAALDKLKAEFGVADVSDALEIMRELAQKEKV